MFLLAANVSMPLWLFALIVLMLFGLVWLSFEIKKAPDAKDLWGYDPDDIKPANSVL